MWTAPEMYPPWRKAPGGAVSRVGEVDILIATNMPFHGQMVYLAPNLEDGVVRDGVR